MQRLALNVMWTILLVVGDVSAQPRSLSDLKEDEQLSEALKQAYDSGLPHRKLLVDHIGRLIEGESDLSASDFKIGALDVLRHSDFSNDLKMGELYLRLLQQPVVDDIFDAFDATAAIKVDGARKDWPRGAVLQFPESELKTDQILESFAVLRGKDRLVVLFGTRKSQERESKQIYNLEVSTLANRYAEPVYTIRVAGQQVRLFDAEGKEIADNTDVPIQVAERGRIIEMGIPIKRLSDDLRSIAVRGYVLAPGNGSEPLKSPWVACPTGPISDPTEMLIYFASKRQLPEGHPLPLAVALQEGLLVAASHADLKERIRSDAYAHLEVLLKIEAQMSSTEVPKASELSISALLAWACRYVGHEPLDTIEQYEFEVPSPKTIADMLGYAQVKGWLTQAKPETLRGEISNLLGLEFKTFDYPDRAARENGKEYLDPNAGAYFTEGEQRLLSYRDVGVNQRWKFYEVGFGLKGSQEQAIEFQRIFGNAVGLPSVWAWHRYQQNDTHYTLSYDGRRQRWYVLGMVKPNMPEKARTILAWGKPWTRPERFGFWHEQPELLPEGYARYFLDGDSDELTGRRFQNVLEKGLADETLARTLLAPLRMR